MAHRFSDEEIGSIRKQCEDIVSYDETRTYVETGVMVDGIEDCLKVEIQVASDLTEDDSEWSAAVPLLELMLAAVRQEIADGKPIERRPPHIPEPYPDDKVFSRRRTSITQLSPSEFLVKREDGQPITVESRQRAEKIKRRWERKLSQERQFAREMASE